jgi:hypothetical protein
VEWRENYAEGAEEKGAEGFLAPQTPLGMTVEAYFELEKRGRRKRWVAWMVEGLTPEGGGTGRRG